MDDEYRAFLESAWNGDNGLTATSATVNGANSLDKGAADVVNEVVEIEADDEDVDEAAEGAREAQGAAVAAQGEAGAPPAEGATPGAGGRRGPLGGAAAHDPQALELATFVGTWKDSAGFTIKIDGPLPGADSLDATLIPKTGKAAERRVKVTQHSDGSFSCGGLKLKMSESRPDRVVWETKTKKLNVWQRESPASPRPTAAAPQAAAQPRGAAGAERMNGAPQVAGGPTPASASTAAAKAPSPSDGVRSLGARAKVKPSRPAALDSAAGAEEPAAGIELETFLGSWADSMGNAVKVDWALPTLGGPGGRRQLEAQFLRPRGQPIRHKITELEGGRFECGHYSLALAKSSPTLIVWADKGSAARESIWRRPSGGAAGAPAAPGLKRSLSQDGGPGPASKLARPPGPAPGPGLLLRQGSFNWAPPPAGRPPLAARPAGPPGQPRPPAAALRDVPPDAKDAEGRLYDLRSVVVNFADVAAGYARSVLAKSPQHGVHDFDWEGVRRCVRYMRAEREMQIFGVVPEDFQAQDSGSGHRCGLPFDVQLMCECVEEALPEPHSGEQGSAREMTVERAYERNCLYVDSGHGAAPLACHAKCRMWLERCRDLLHLRYFFDSTIGTFDVFDGNVGPPTLARMNSFS